MNAIPEGEVMRNTIALSTRFLLQHAFLIFSNARFHGRSNTPKSPKISSK